MSPTSLTLWRQANTFWKDFNRHYTFEIAHCKGTENVVADALSRCRTEGGDPVGHESMIGEIKRT